MADQDTTIVSTAADDATQVAPVKEEVKEEEKKVDTEVKEEEKSTTFDQSKFDESIKPYFEDLKVQLKDEFGTEVANKIATALKGEQKPEVKGEIDQTPPWVKDNRNPKDWAEVTQWIAQTSLLIQKQEAKKEADAKAEEEKGKTTQNQQTEKQWTDYWNAQVADLTTAKKIPDIAPEVKAKMDKGTTLTAEEMRDEGLVARLDLYTLMKEKNRTSVKDVFYEDYQDFVKAKKPAGEDAPISAGRSNASTEGDKDEFSYEEIRGAKKRGGVFSFFNK